MVADRAYRAAVAAAQAHGPRLITHARSHLDLTQRELAEKMNIDPSYISKIENGRIPPSKPFLRSLVALLERNEVKQ